MTGSVSSNRSIARAALWAALALLGHAALLSLVEAGKDARYQALPFPEELFTSAHAAPLAVLGLQAALVLVALGRHLPDAFAVLRRHAPHGRWLLVLFVVFASSAHELWKVRPGYYYELMEATFFELVAFGNLVLVGRALPTERVRAFVERLGASPSGRFDPVVVGAALWVLIVSFTLAGVSYEFVPHVPDESVYLLHARYFAEGRMSVPVPPVQDAFLIDIGYVRDGRMVSPVPPGWPAVLAVGVALGAPWLVNPVLGAAIVLVLAAFVRRLYGQEEARVCALLFAASPWFVFVSMSLMTHNTSLLAALIAAYAVLRLRQGGGLGWAALGGAGLGAVSLVRPLEGLVMAVLLGLWSLLQARTAPRWLLIRTTVLAACTAIAGAIVLPYNAHITGDPFYFPIMAYTDDRFAPGSNTLGFGPEKGLGWVGLDPRHGHDLRDAKLNTGLNVFAINVELLGWACGSILPIALAVFARRIDRRDLWMLAPILGISGAHVFYWFSGGPDFGARYWYLVIAPCIVLAMRGVLQLARSVDDRWPGARPKVVAAALFASVSATALFVPWRAVDKYHDYRGANADFARLVEAEGIEGGLVLVHGNHHPEYGAAADLNPLDIEGSDETVFAWDRKLDTSLAVLDAFAPEKVWLVEGPSITEDGYRVVLGPVDVAEAKLELARRWQTREEREP